MPKNSGESMKIRTAPPRPQPSRQIKHQVPPPASRTVASAQSASKFADSLQSAPKKKSGSVDPRQMRY